MKQRLDLPTTAKSFISIWPSDYVDVDGWEVAFLFLCETIEIKTEQSMKELLQQGLPISPLLLSIQK